jgi:hypothetical protein
MYDGIEVEPETVEVRGHSPRRLPEEDTEEILTEVYNVKYASEQE